MVDLVAMNSPDLSAAVAYYGLIRRQEQGKGHQGAAPAALCRPGHASQRGNSRLGRGIESKQQEIVRLPTSPGGRTIPYVFQGKPWCTAKAGVAEALHLTGPPNCLRARKWPAHFGLKRAGGWGKKKKGRGIVLIVSLDRCRVTQLQSRAWTGGPREAGGSSSFG